MFRDLERGYEAMRDSYESKGHSSTLQRRWSIQGKDGHSPQDSWKAPNLAEWLYEREGTRRLNQFPSMSKYLGWVPNSIETFCSSLLGTADSQEITRGRISQFSWLLGVSERCF